MTEETTVRNCPRCGHAIPVGRIDCPHCDHRFEQFLHSRETVLSGCIILIIILFFVTEGVARAYHVKLHALAGEWFAEGEQDLSSGSAQKALADFRNALVYEPEDPRIQFRLTEALIANDRDEEAHSYLFGLLAHSPSNAEVNLELARIATRSGSEAEALRYYHAAIYGVWLGNPEMNRLNTRLELSRFLIGRSDAANADGELIALEAEIPQQHGGAVLHEQTGELLLQAGDVDRALREFRKALASGRPPVGALRGAGLSAFQMGDFRLAERYLERAYREKRNDSEVGATLETTQLILAWDPEAPGLADTDRRERERHDFAQAFSRLQSCARDTGTDLTDTAKPQSDLTTLYAQARAMQPRLSERNLARHPEPSDVVMNLVLAIESATVQKCGQPAGLDKALLAMETSRQGRER